MNDESETRRFASPDWIIGALGPIAFAVLRLGQEYSNRRQLAKASRVGKDVTARPGLFLHAGGEILIGDRTSFGAQVDLVSYPSGRIEIGNDVFIGSHCAIVSERATISIGRDCLIAEGVSLRASNHGTRLGQPMRRQPNEAADIRIGEDVWLGKGVTVCAGAVVADGCVVGANSVVTGTTEPNGVYVGAPARRVRERGR